MAPDFGLGAQAPHRVVEHLDHEVRVQHLVGEPLRGQEMDLRLFHLDDAAARVRELVQLLVQRVADGEDALAQVAVMQVAHRHGDELGHDGAELHRPPGQALRRFPHRRVLQRAAPDRPRQVRHHARLEHVVQDMPGLVRKPGFAAGAVIRGSGKAAHAQRRVGKPVVAGDVRVEAAIAVGDDVESRGFLVAQVRRDGIQVLLAIRAVDHGFPERSPAEIFGVPRRARQRTGDGRGKGYACGGFVHAEDRTPKPCPGNRPAATMKQEEERR
jgi:hypothetical protein